MDVPEPPNRTDAEGGGEASIEAERTAGARSDVNHEELADDQEANRPRTGEEFLTNVAQEPS